MITYEDITTNEEINNYITQSDLSLKALGYTEHSFAHVTKVATDAAYILETLKYPKRDIELVKIAAYMHDIGNLVNRVEHSQSGAVMAFKILKDLNMDTNEIAIIVSAIGNHDEGTGIPVNHIAAALIIADKADVRRSRVRNKNEVSIDIHDRVNYSVTSSKLKIEGDKLILSLTLDNSISSVLDYFEIFLKRMLMCKNAAKAINLEFKLTINEQPIL